MVQQWLYIIVQQWLYIMDQQLLYNMVQQNHIITTGYAAHYQSQYAAYPAANQPSSLITSPLNPNPTTITPSIDN